MWSRAVVISHTNPYERCCSTRPSESRWTLKEEEKRPWPAVCILYADHSGHTSLAISVAQYPSSCQWVCPNNFTVHTKRMFFFSISKCLQKHDIEGFVFIIWGPDFCCVSPCCLSCALWQWRCLNLRGPSSSIPMTALYLMSLKMHALLAAKNEIK